MEISNISFSKLIIFLNYIFRSITIQTLLNNLIIFFFVIYAFVKGFYPKILLKNEKSIHNYFTPY